MKPILLTLTVALLASCTSMEESEDKTSPPLATPAPAPTTSTNPAPLAEPISLRPLVGIWRVVSVSGKAYPDPATGLFPNIRFEDSGFLSHWAGCGGAFPAFYTLDGDRIAITRREAVRIGKCGGPGDAERERTLADALDRVSSWEGGDSGYVLLTDDGSRIVLARPSEPIPALGGRWLLETIDGQPLGSDRTAEVTLSRGFLGAGADCNSLSTDYSADETGRFRVTGSMTTTEMGCAPADNAEDARLFGALHAATEWSIDDAGRLVLSGPKTLILRRPTGRENAYYIP